jgi:hypothetical protein
MRSGLEASADEKRRMRDREGSASPATGAEGRSSIHAIVTVEESSS